MPMKIIPPLSRKRDPPLPANEAPPHNTQRSHLAGISMVGANLPLWAVHFFTSSITPFVLINQYYSSSSISTIRPHTNRTSLLSKVMHFIIETPSQQGEPAMQ